jgi:uroporphyrin-III C-methyltransferase/precorrin-2 dehydrogenase/sirohydrochlorin ferrochelatase
VDYLPLFFDLRGKPVLLVGGGTIALRKARLLVKAQARVIVVAPEVSGELESMVIEGGGSVHRELYREAYLDQVVLVISATDQPDINRQVAEDCQRRRLPVNVVDSPELCSVIMPAIVDRSPLMIGISSGGQAPVLSRMVRAQIESAIPAAYSRVATFASRCRDQVKAHFTDGDMRRRFWEKILAGPAKEMALSGNITEAEEYLLAQLRQPQAQTGGEVYLVGAGPGDPDLLTFKALRLMQQAEVVLYDRLVSAPILDLVRRDAERIYVGKRRAAHALEQTEINQLLLDLALQGKRVLRLKGGDPFIFGRGGEEIELLAQHKVPFQVVPGITAASGCACYAGIPLTHRDFAQSVRFVTGHLKNGTCDLSWNELIGNDQTLVFYMGLASLPEISQKLIAHGKDPSTPAALIEQGTTPRQQVHTATLASLPELVAERGVRAPTLLIIGGVVSLHQKLRWFSPDGEAVE